MGVEEGGGVSGFLGCSMKLSPPAGDWRDFRPTSASARGYASHAFCILFKEC